MYCPFLMIVILLIFVILAICLGLFLKYADSDLTLLLYDKYGNPAGILRRKVVWITGASSGIGECLAYELSKYGTCLILSGTNLERLQKVKSNCIGNGLSEDNIFILPFDMCSFDDHGKMCKEAVEHFGKLDILVNNAGRSQRANFIDISLDVDRQMFDLNVFATINLTRFVLRYFLENKKKGQFVVTSSCVGKMGAPNSASYTASKHALHGYFETIRTETARDNIKVTIVCPGPVFSNFLANAFTSTVGEKLGGSTDPSDKRMETTRCAHLIAVAMAYEVDEAWISCQPPLLLYYLAQYTPSFFRKVVMEKIYTPERAAKVREGRL